MRGIGSWHGGSLCSNSLGPLPLPSPRKAGSGSLFALLLTLLPLPAAAEMRGHGGPVRAIAISSDGKTAVTGSFDTTVIVWDLERETAKQVLRFHEAPVNVVRFAGQGFITASDDGRVAVWSMGRDQPDTVHGQRGGAPASATELGPLPDMADRPVAAAASGGALIVSRPDATLRWVGTNRSVSLPTTANALVATPDGEVIAGGADGKVYLVTPEGSLRLTVEVQELPVTSLSLSVDGKLIAAAGLRGAVTILDRQTGKPVSTLIGPGLPVWSLAFHPDGKTLYTGGADRMVRKWNVATGQPLAPANAPRADFPPGQLNERGAQVFRACEACHTVTPDGGNRAGPTLHGVFGRKIGTAAGYNYSAEFAKLPIVWNAETITRLFRDGPTVVTPGTKMPEQKVTDPEDLKALVDWLEKVTR
jgi:cytochrome c